MARIPETCAPVKARIVLEAALEEVVQTLCHTVGARITDLLVAIVSHVVGRPHYVRRAFIPKRLCREGRCCPCHCTQSRRFSRNGFRSGQPLLTIWGEVPFDLPRVRCQCGGSMQVAFGDLIRPYQQIGADVDTQIQRWGSMAVSLRRMHQELKHTYIGSLALRTLNQRLHLLATLDPHREAEDVPPVVQLDAIWITLLRPNGRVCHDRKGRKRAVAGRLKVPVMIAMVVWPDSDRCEILSWVQGESESAEEWAKFLEALEAQGISDRNGLELIIHDAGLGLCSALQTVWFDAQRTTNRLERLNRNLRRRTRAANAYHSNVGLMAMLAQEVRSFHDAQRSPEFPPKEIHYRQVSARSRNSCGASTIWNSRRSGGAADCQ